MTAKAFIVHSKDLFDATKNPNLSLSVKDIEANTKIPKKYLAKSPERQKGAGGSKKGGKVIG